MPRTPQQNEAIRKKTRVKIMKSALAMFAERGYYGASMNTIALHAGVSKGLIYSYYDSKEDLLSALIDYQIELFTPLQQFLQTNAEAPPMKMRRLIQKIFETYQTHRDLFVLYHAILLQPNVLAILQKRSKSLEEGVRIFYTSIEQLFRDLGYNDPLREMRKLKMLFNGMIFNNLVLARMFPIHELEELLVEEYHLPELPKDE
ncbi:MAG: TetR/AcrR family transcriptional regulator [Patescibacteria group bacterium]